METPEKILIVDDDRALTDMLAELLQAEGFDCAVANDGRDAIRQEKTMKPDLVILDVMMPGDDGIATLRALREKSAVRVLMLTAMGEDDDRILGLEAGADDYLAKPFIPRELILRIRAILRRSSDASSPDSTTPLVAGPLSIELDKERATIGNQMLPLTGAELRILAALASPPGQVVSREQLTRDALGRELSPYDRALDTHVSHLRNKLRKAHDSDAIQIRSVRGAGYRLVTN